MSDNFFFQAEDGIRDFCLSRGLVELYGIDGNAAYVDAVQRSLDYAWDHARDGRGLFETDFTGADKQAEKWLLTQGAMAEMYGRMSGVGLK